MIFAIFISLLYVGVVIYVFVKLKRIADRESKRLQAHIDYLDKKYIDDSRMTRVDTAIFKKEIEKTMSIAAKKQIESYAEYYAEWFARNMVQLKREQERNMSASESGDFPEEFIC